MTLARAQVAKAEAAVPPQLRPAGGEFFRALMLNGAARGARTRLQNETLANELMTTAVASLDRAAVLAPAGAPAIADFYRAKGLMLWDWWEDVRTKRCESKPALKKYLGLRPEAQDRDSIRRKIADLPGAETAASSRTAPLASLPFRYVHGANVIDRPSDPGPKYCRHVIERRRGVPLKMPICCAALCVQRDWGNSMRTIIVVLVIVSAWVAALPAPVHAGCPTGSYPFVDNWGNNICRSFDDGGTRSIEGSLSRCPTGTHPWVDSWGNQICQSLAAISNSMTRHGVVPLGFIHGSTIGATRYASGSELDALLNQTYPQQRCGVGVSDLLSGVWSAVIRAGGGRRKAAPTRGMARPLGRTHRACPCPRSYDDHGRRGELALQGHASVALDVPGRAALLTAPDATSS